MTRLIESGEIAVARVNGDLVGAVRMQAVAEDTGEFGMLVADPERRGIGIGRDLVAFAEGHYREGGMRAMQLELLVPRDWEHPNKVFLDDWYRRIGYRVIRTTTLDEAYPELGPLLATPCRVRDLREGALAAQPQPVLLPHRSTCSNCRCAASCRRTGRRPGPAPGRRPSWPGSPAGCR